jgi:hypothetical protein
VKNLSHQEFFLAFQASRAPQHAAPRFTPRTHRCRIDNGSQALSDNSFFFSDRTDVQVNVIYITRTRDYNRSAKFANWFRGLNQIFFRYFRALTVNTFQLHCTRGCAPHKQSTALCWIPL